MVAALGLPASIRLASPFLMWSAVLHIYMCHPQLFTRSMSEA